MRSFHQVVLLLMVVFSTACIGSTTYHTATPIEKGTLEIGVMPGLYGVSAKEESTGESLSLTLPMVELGIRTGLTDNIDLGVRLNGLTVTTDVNIAIINEPSFAMSIDPSLTLLYFDFGEGSLFWTFATVGLLFDVIKTESTTLMLGLKPGFIYSSVGVSGDDESVYASGSGLTIGATAGVKFRISKNFALMPNIDVMSPVENFGVGLIYNAGIGLLF